MSYMLPIVSIASMQYAERTLLRSKELPRISSVSRIRPFNSEEKETERRIMSEASHYGRIHASSQGLYVNELI